MIRLATIAAAIAALALPASALAGAANGDLPGAPSNPIAGVMWGAYKTDSTDPSLDPPSAYYNTAHNDRDRADFAKLLAVPRFRWFGSWVPTFDRGTKWGARKTAAKYIEAAQQFNALPHTTVYIDAGASDWLRPTQAASMLKRAGVGHVRGFALNLTHYDSTPRSVAYGKQIVRWLGSHGVRGVHFTVSTAMNGRPFISYKHRRTFRLGTECKSRSDRACVTLGQQPTTQTSTPLCDGYLWYGRPWIDNAFRRSYDDLLQVIRTSPFF